MEPPETGAPRPSPLPSLLPEAAEGGSGERAKVSGCVPSPHPLREGLDGRPQCLKQGEAGNQAQGTAPFLPLWGQKEDGAVNMSEPGGREDGRQQDTGTL